MTDTRPSAAAREEYAHCCEEIGCDQSRVVLAAFDCLDELAAQPTDAEVEAALEKVGWKRCMAILRSHLRQPDRDNSKWWEGRDRPATRILTPEEYDAEHRETVRKAWEKLNWLRKCEGRGGVYFHKDSEILDAIAAALPKETP